VLLVALKKACDIYLAKYFQNVNLTAIHAGRVKIKDKDFAFVRSIQHEDKIFDPSIPAGVDKTHKK
jgi:histone H3/H4